MRYPGPALHLMCLPASVLADGIDWGAPQNGSQVKPTVGQRRNEHPVLQGAIGTAGQTRQGTKDKGLEKPDSAKPKRKVTEHDKRRRAKRLKKFQEYFAEANQNEAYAAKLLADELAATARVAAQAARCRGEHSSN